MRKIGKEWGPAFLVKFSQLDGTSKRAGIKHNDKLGCICRVLYPALVGYSWGIAFLAHWLRNGNNKGVSKQLNFSYKTL